MTEVQQEHFFSQHLALDRLTLEQLTLEVGERIDESRYLQSLIEASQNDLLFSVYRQEMLVAYATLHAQENDTWFVLMFVVHPQYRKFSVIKELLQKVVGHLLYQQARYVKSNVFKTNLNSLGFHRSLGFKVSRENDKGYEFTLDLEQARQQRGQRWLQRLMSARPE